MHIITRKRLNEFAKEHPNALKSLDEWYRRVKQARWQNFAEIKATFRAADQVGRFVVFDVGGNKFRLITVIRYQRHKVFIRACLTHKEYDENNWKD
ncbi:MAG TPA: type II toxin-antitoxin system HigB family toxin [Candidatus Kapabacteria bacterium]|nr:type II toxin-antitoxin system HigB family toxin [Candidatus Kapabacteria bacterium]